ncbi:YaeQ family protein [Vibrio gallicus]|uniref:YaeQ family protein n=1 Tax=Vibrio gallicus TaxID=190897 RepID=UPI0021C2A768|nr:YaeQ family protein [Vibrio gallicus]
MALKPTIYKFRVNLADTNQNKFDDFNLTVALHPSETNERMLARIVAFALNYTPELTFTKGLSDQEQPDIWLHDDSGITKTWIEVGEPSYERLKKATRLAETVKVYPFADSKSQVWFDKNQSKLSKLDLSVTKLDGEALLNLVAGLQRTNDLSVMCSEDSIYLTLGEISSEFRLQPLQ